MLQQVIPADRVASGHRASGAYKVDISRGERIGRLSSEWFSRPDDERFLSLTEFYEAVRAIPERATARSVESRAIRVEAARDDAERLSLVVPGAPEPIAPTHWSFGQMRSLLGVPAAYLRQLPAALVGINMQHGLLSRRAELVKTLEADDGRGLISCWMNLAIMETLSLKPSRERRIWFHVDELDALGRIEGLKDAQARLRKFGGRVAIGFQSFAQVKQIYGEGAHTIIEKCGNLLLLRSGGSEGGGTAELASDLIGSREVERNDVSRSRREGISHRDRHRCKASERWRMSRLLAKSCSCVTEKVL